LLSRLKHLLVDRDDFAPGYGRRAKSPRRRAGLGSLDADGPVILNHHGLRPESSRSATGIITVCDRNHHGLRPDRLLDAWRLSAGTFRLSPELSRRNLSAGIYPQEFIRRNLSAGTYPQELE
jgi:hypothetical protein